MALIIISSRTERDMTGRTGREINYREKTMLRLNAVVIVRVSLNGPTYLAEYLKS
jgi:hypothetical protein